jgi:NitT/TauT family transport system substrate-binding protein
MRFQFHSPAKRLPSQQFFSGSRSHLGSGATIVGRTLAASLCVLSAVAGIAGCSSPTSTTSASAPSSATGANSSQETGATSPATQTASTGAPLTIGYSDYPAYLVWDIAEQKGFLKQQGVNVQLKWFSSYSDGMNAFASHALDANCLAWNDYMAPLAQGVKSKAVMMMDYSYGADAIIAKPGITSLKDLRGKKVATEMGTVDHFLLLKALQTQGMTEKDIQFTNIAIQDCPNVMLAGRVDAASVWEPSRTKLLSSMKGSKVVFDSANLPGQICDVLTVQDDVIQSRSADVQKAVSAYYQAVDWWRTHPDEAVQIMSKRTGTPAAQYKAFVQEAHILSAQQSLDAMQGKDPMTSLWKSGEDSARFLIKVNQIPTMPDYKGSLDTTFVQGAIKANIGKKGPYDYKLK